MNIFKKDKRFSFQKINKENTTIFSTTTKCETTTHPQQRLVLAVSSLRLPSLSVPSTEDQVKQSSCEIPSNPQGSFHPSTAKSRISPTIHPSAVKSVSTPWDHIYEC